MVTLSSVSGSCLCPARVQDLERRDLVVRRLVEECWDAMEVQATCVRALTSTAVVNNFAIRRLYVPQPVLCGVQQLVSLLNLVWVSL